MRAKRICERVLKADGIDEVNCIEVLRLMAIGYGSFYECSSAVRMRGYGGMFKGHDDFLDWLSRHLLRAGIAEPLEEYFTRLATRVNLFEDAEE